MSVFAVDDEKGALALLADAIRSAMPNETIYTFTSSKEAVEKSREIIPEIAFLDIQMPDMSGIELARRLKTVNSKINLIFVTAYSEYAMDALSLRASGYIMKPPTASRIKEEVENLLYPVHAEERGIFARTFGHFVLYVDGKPIHFKREKAKEMMAILIDMDGAEISNEQIAAILYEDAPYDEKIKNSLTTVISDLRKTLDGAGIGDVLIKKYGHLQLDKTKFRCDAYDYWNGLPYAMNQFRGEYLEEYSWAEDSKAKFYWDMLDTLDSIRNI